MTTFAAGQPRQPALPTATIKSVNKSVIWLQTHQEGLNLENSNSYIENGEKCKK